MAQEGPKTTKAGMSKDTSCPPCTEDTYIYSFWPGRHTSGAGRAAASSVSEACMMDFWIRPS